MNSIEEIKNSDIRAEWHKIQSEFDEFLSKQISSISRMYDNAKSNEDIARVKEWEEKLVQLKQFVNESEGYVNLYRNKLEQITSLYHSILEHNIFSMEEVRKVYTECLTLNEVLIEKCGIENGREKFKDLVYAFKKVDENMMKVDDKLLIDIYNELERRGLKRHIDHSLVDHLKRNDKK